MMNYALIKNGIVVNTVVCESDDVAIELFQDFTVVNITDSSAGIGWRYNGENFTPPEIVQSPEELAAANLAKAQSEYEAASVKIIALNEQIADEDYAGTTEEAVKAELESWTGYRKQQRAYIKAADFSEMPPVMLP